ncbi:FidL-like protein, partial [Salmonella enterica subsp. enterica serovar Infantis]
LNKTKGCLIANFATVPIDESPNVIFDYFMREMSDSHDGLFLNAQKLNEKAILLSSINSPLWICTLKSGSKLN